MTTSPLEPYDPRRRLRAHLESVILEDMARTQRREEQKKHASIQTKLHELENQHEAFPHYTDDNYLKSRAKAAWQSQPTPGRPQVR